MIDNHGNSYDTIETVKNTWRRTYPVSDEIIENIFVQIKTIEKISLEEREYKRESYQISLTQIIADYLCKYIKRSATYENLSSIEVEAIIRQKIDISENKRKAARFIIKQSTPKYIYIKDLSETEKNITNDAQTVLWHIYRHNSLGNRRLFFRDTLDNYNEILHENGILKGITAGISPWSKPEE